MYYHWFINCNKYNALMEMTVIGKTGGVSNWEREYMGTLYCLLNFSVNLILL